MGDLATLLTAIGTVGSFGVSSFALLLGWLRTSKRERKDAAAIAAERAEQVAEAKAFEELLDALADGHVSEEDVAQIREHLHRRDKEAEGE